MVINKAAKGLRLTLQFNKKKIHVAIAILLTGKGKNCRSTCEIMIIAYDINPYLGVEKEYTVDSLYLKHPLSRTSLYLELKS